MKLRAYTPDDYMKIVGRAIEKAVNKSCLIIFFGSILTDKFSRTSDIDVGVFCGAPLTPKEYVSVLEEIEKAPILREVDLVDLAKVDDERFLSSILERGKIWKSSRDLFQSWRDLKENEIPHFWC
ncbi:DNA polymerase beta domain protein region [Desulfurobacterium thermolithotrophum DSM 11699]|uniref:DNA polymerase beta domain protein region n=1 Tax=Desulfurobacterium thermolithotrophum (strain DSM 11699 / BSA) TaxID=868864 RepID=F0S1K3_DESTD|nr:nucleotidyltransferase domain-containing protein [Desulfurobacterium thermolithotrophum]ADY74006.1 DNA polymerase beta domain protein region [Desulfurobacterium thermolithotrophum DSM 11699]